MRIYLLEDWRDAGIDNHSRQMEGPCSKDGDRLSAAGLCCMSLAPMSILARLVSPTNLQRVGVTSLFAGCVYKASGMPPKVAVTHRLPSL